MTKTSKTTATLADAITAREARMNGAVQQAATIGHAITIDANTVTCTCGHTATCAPRATKVMADMHAREVLGTLSVPTLA